VARFYLDNDVALALASRLLELGHDAVTARDQGASHAGDYEQLLISTDLDRVLVTHNERHFRDLHSTWRLWLPHFGVRAQHAGILIIPQPPRTGHIDIAGEVNALTERHSELASSLWLWRAASDWGQIDPRVTYFRLPDS